MRSRAASGAHLFDGARRGLAGLGRKGAIELAATEAGHLGQVSTVTPDAGDRAHD
jgi:hypothetical protein